MAEFIKGDLDIAVIGMACRFPCAEDISQFRENIISGRDCITRKASASGDNYVSAFGRLGNIYDFDSSFFGIKKEEARMLDPQQRIFLETVYSALADAGCARKGISTGIFAGSDEFGYVWKRICRNGYDEKEFEKRSLFLSGSLTSYMSYKLDLYGPSITMRSACSTSLTAVHYAMMSLLNYECDICIAGGVAVTEEQEGYRMSENTLSVDGYTRSFSQNGTGFVPGSGSGAVVLKRLEDAVEDNDRIYAVIRGSAVTNDGSTKAGYTAPSIKGIGSAIQNAYDISGISPDDVEYVECHGTGTVIGDAVEIQALDRIFSSERRTKCRVGSVKSNIGHTNMASGIASLIKTIFMVREGVFAPSINCDEPNMCFDSARNVILCKERERWESGRRVAGVTAFGIGGTNCHMIVENYDVPSESAFSRYGICFVSADSTSQLERNMSDSEAYCTSDEEISYPSVTYTTLRKQPECRYRTFIVLDKEGGVLRSGVTDTDDCCHESVAFILNDLEDADEERISELKELYPAFASSYDEMLKKLRLPENSVQYRKYAVNVSFCYAYVKCITDMVSGIEYTVTSASGTDYLSGGLSADSSALIRYHERYTSAEREAATSGSSDDRLEIDITPSSRSYAADICRAGGELWAHGNSEGGGIIDVLSAGGVFEPLPFGFANKEYCFDEV